MKTFASNEEFFQAFERLIARIDDHGQRDTANCLREGLSSLNGLTDGWALLMDSIVTTISKKSDELKPEDKNELEEMLKVVQNAVYRK